MYYSDYFSEGGGVLDKVIIANNLFISVIYSQFVVFIETFSTKKACFSSELLYYFSYVCDLLCNIYRIILMAILSLKFLSFLWSYMDYKSAINV